MGMDWDAQVSRSRKKAEVKKREQLQTALSAGVLSHITTGSFDGVREHVSKGADINFKNGVALQAAAARSDLAMVRFLREELKAKYYKDRCVLEEAAKRPTLEVFDYLLNNGAHIEGNFGSAFEGAFGAPHEREICERLLSSGVRIDALNRSTIGYAATHASEDTFLYLLENGRASQTQLWQSLPRIAEMRPSAGGLRWQMLMPKLLSTNMKYGSEAWWDALVNGALNNCINGETERACADWLQHCLSVAPDEATKSAIIARAVLYATRKAGDEKALHILLLAGGELPEKVGQRSTLSHFLDHGRADLLAEALRRRDFPIAQLKRTRSIADQRSLEFAAMDEEKRRERRSLITATEEVRAILAAALNLHALQAAAKLPNTNAPHGGQVAFDFDHTARIPASILRL